MNKKTQISVLLGLIFVAVAAPMQAMNKYKQQLLAYHLQQQIKQQQNEKTLREELKRTKKAVRFQKEVGQGFTPRFTVEKNLGSTLMILTLLAAAAAQGIQAQPTTPTTDRNSPHPICLYTKKEYTQPFVDRLKEHSPEYRLFKTIEAKQECLYKSKNPCPEYVLLLRPQK